MTTAQTSQGSTDAQVLYMALEPTGMTGHRGSPSGWGRPCVKSPSVHGSTDGLYK
jgi:hypothetical protein